MRVMKKNAALSAHCWDGQRDLLPDWLKHRVLSVREDSGAIVLKNGVHHVTAAQGDVIVLGENHTLEAWSAQSFAAQFDVLGEPEPEGDKKPKKEKGGE